MPTTTVDPWLSLAQRRDEQLTELERMLEAVTEAALAEVLAGIWGHVLGVRVALIASADPPNTDGLETAADRAWRASLERWVKPVLTAGWMRHYREQPGDRQPRQDAIDAWWDQLVDRLANAVQAIVHAIQETVRRFRRESIDQLRDRVARILQLDAFTQTIRDQIADVEAELLNPTLSKVDLGAAFARRVRLQSSLFLVQASRARSQGLAALASIAPDDQKTQVREAARQAARPVSAVRDAERELSRLDETLFRNPELDPARYSTLRAKLAALYGQGHANHETWRASARRDARTEATAVLNAATLARGLDEATATGDEYIKRWFATLTDDRTRPTHRHAHGQVVAIDQQFRVGDAFLDMPGDVKAPAEERIQCRCAMGVMTRVEHDEIAATLQASAAEEVPMTEVLAEPSVQTELPIGWRGVLAPIETRTGDGRYLRMPEGGVRFRQDPLPIAFQPKIADGHDGGVIVSRIAKYWVENNADGVPMLWGQGPFDLGKPEGYEAARELHVGNANGISVDLDDITVTWDEETETAYFDNWRVMGATLVPHPAFDEARVQPVYADDLDLTLVASLTAAAAVEIEGTVASISVLERSDFEPPQLDGPTPITVTEDGRIYGHLARWGVCHIGIGNACVVAPHSVTGYAYFHTGAVLLKDGSELAVGKITLGGGHADPELGFVAAAEHYDDVCSMVAFVRASEDEWGIALAGRILPNVGDDRIMQLRAAPMSGDWRRVGGNLELVASLGVVTPGFMVPRTVAASANGNQISLVAAGVLKPRSLEEAIAAEVRAVRKRERLAAELADRMKPTPEELKARAASLASRMAPTN